MSQKPKNFNRHLNSEVTISRLQVGAYILVYITPIAGGLMLMVSVIQIILDLEKGSFLEVVYPLTVPFTIGVILIISGFLLLVGLVQKKANWVFIYLTASTPSLVYLMCEAVTMQFLDLHFKIPMIIIVGFMLSDQLCVIMLFIFIVRIKRSKSIESLVLYNKYGYLNSQCSSSFSLSDVTSV